MEIIGKDDVEAVDGEGGVPFVRGVFGDVLGQKEVFGFCLAEPRDEGDERGQSFDVFREVDGVVAVVGEGEVSGDLVWGVESVVFVVGVFQAVFVEPFLGVLHQAGGDVVGVFEKADQQGGQRFQVFADETERGLGESLEAKDGLFDLGPVLGVAVGDGQETDEGVDPLDESAGVSIVVSVLF